MKGVVFTHTKQLYCWNFSFSKITGKKWPDINQGVAGKAFEVRTIPTDVLLQPNQKQKLKFQSLDEKGHVLSEIKNADFQNLFHLLLR